MTDKIAIERKILEHTVIALEYAYGTDDVLIAESIKFLRHALAGPPSMQPLPNHDNHHNALYAAPQAWRPDIGEVVVTRNDAGEIVAVTRQDDEGRILSVIAEAQPSPARELVAWKHDCAGLCANDVELWLDACPHCGKPRTTPPAQPAHTYANAKPLILAQQPAEAQPAPAQEPWKCVCGANLYIDENGKPMSKASQQEQKPVAWRHSKTGQLYDLEEEVPLADGDEWAEPLYAAPVAQQEPSAWRQWSTKQHDWDYQTNRGDLRPDTHADPLFVAAAQPEAIEQALQKIADFGQDQEQQRPPHDPRR